MTMGYAGTDVEAHEPESLKTIATALELGINFLDTAWGYRVRKTVLVQQKDHYFALNITNFHMPKHLQIPKAGGGLHTNEELVGKAIKIHGRDKFVIATKFGISATSQVRSHRISVFCGLSM